MGKRSTAQFLNNEKSDKHVTCWRAKHRLEKRVIFSFQFYVPLMEVAPLITASVFHTQSCSCVLFDESCLPLLVVPRLSLLVPWTIT